MRRDDQTPQRYPQAPEEELTLDRPSKGLALAASRGGNNHVVMPKGLMAETLSSIGETSDVRLGLRTRSAVWICLLGDDSHLMLALGLVLRMTWRPPARGNPPTRQPLIARS